MIKLLEKRQPKIIERAEVITADKAYDDTKLTTSCRDEYKILDKSFQICYSII